MARNPLLVVVSVYVTACLAVWVLTGPPFLAFINWDQGSYLAAAVFDPSRFLKSPWNAHFLVGYVYAVGVAIVRKLDGTVVDGFRLMTALVAAVTPALLAWYALRRTGSLAFALLGGVVWLVAWPTLFLVLSLEDNLLFGPLVVGAILIALWFKRRWHLLGAGALVGAASLVSWQAVPFLGLVLYGVVLGGPTRSKRQRAIDAIVVVAGFVLALLVASLLPSAVDGPGPLWALRSMVSRPTGNFSIRGLTDVSGIAASLGHGFHQVLFVVEDPLASERTISAATLGGLMMIPIFALAIGGLYVWRRHGSFEAHYLTACFAALALSPGLYPDVRWRYIVRYDFLPAFVVMLLVAVLHARPRARRAVLGSMLLVVGVEVWLGTSWLRAKHASYASHQRYAEHLTEPATWFGRDQQSWLGYFRTLRASTPNACGYVFAVEDVAVGSWWFEATALMASELRGAVVFDPSSSTQTWRFKPPHVKTPPVDRPCLWVSPDAAQHIFEWRRLQMASTSGPREVVR